MHAMLRWCVRVGSLALVGALGVGAVTSRIPQNHVYLAGWQLSPEADEWSRRVSRIAQAVESREIVLRAGYESILVPLSELGYRVDQAAVQERLAQSPCGSRAGSPTSGLRSFAGDDTCPDVPLSWAFDESTARTTLERLSPLLATPAIDAALDIPARQRTTEQSGYEVDLEASIARTAALEPMRDHQLALATREALPRVRLVDLPAIDPSKVLSAFETDFSKKRGPRIHNIKVAAHNLDGTLIGPEEVLSFNRVVGARTAARGFIDAPVIINDEMESGMGGGVCQVATALHGAAIFGGLQVKERRSHSRPSGYAPLGLDATVIDGVQDLKVQNPYPVPLYVRAYFPSRFVLRIELIGAEAPGEVSHKYWVVRRHEYTRRLVEKPDLTPGVVQRTQKGGYGYDTVSRVVVKRADGTQEERRYTSKYYPVPEVLWVGPGTTSGDLPPLPGEVQERDSVSL